jgi:hypothetical protein
MAEPHRYRGIARDGKVELEPGAKLPDGAEVTVLFDAASEAADSERNESIKWLLNAMRQGFDLGGRPYFDRNSQYGDSGRPN